MKSLLKMLSWLLMVRLSLMSNINFLDESKNISINVNNVCIKKKNVYYLE